MMRPFKTSGLGGALLLAGVIVPCALLSSRKPVPPAPVTEAVTDRRVEAGALPAAQTMAVAEDYPQPLATISDEALLQLARCLVARSPVQAMVWAQAQAQAALRQRMILAVLRAWGEVDPRSAVHWALARTRDVRETDLRAALTGAVNQPKIAMDLLCELLAEDPDSGGFYAETFTRALGAEGKFQEAIQFLNQAPAGTVADSVRAIFSLWMQRQPQAALAAVDAITDPQMRALAFRTAAASWNPNNPAGLAAYAQTLPEGEDRTCALHTAVNNWSQQDPAGLAAWLNTQPPGAEFDADVALLIARTDGANRPPELAMQWVENISDPALQQASLLRVLGEWTQSDPAAAQQYVANATWLNDQQRQSLLAQHPATVP
jgi:hypothetical protein